MCIFINIRKHIYIVEGCAVGRRALCKRRLYRTEDKKERVRVPSEDWPDEL